MQGPRFACMTALAVVVMLSAVPASAGPWTREPGDWYAKAGTSWFRATSFAGADGLVVDGLTYDGYSAFLYAEAGILPRTQVVAYVPVLHATSSYPDGRQGTRTSLADVILGVQVRPLPASLPFALRLDWKIPAYSTPQDPNALEPLPGDGQHDLTGWVSLGNSWPRPRIYGFAEAGVRWRGDRTLGAEQLIYATTWAAQGQLGWFFHRRHVVALNVRAAVPFEEDDLTRGEVFAGIAMAIALGRGLAVEFGYDLPLWIRNGADGTMATLGLSWSPE